MNLSSLKSAADMAKTSPLNRDEWGEDIDPDDVLRLVEVARLARELRLMETTHMPGSPALFWAKARLDEALKGIES
jgi:hypothetical protein